MTRRTKIVEGKTMLKKHPGSIMLWLLMFYTLSCSLSVPSVAAENRALLIGVSQYIHWPKLMGPTNDVALLRSVLLQRGFKSEYIMTLTDRESTESGIRNVLWQLIQHTQRGDTISLYFASHVFQYDSSIGMDLAIILFDAKIDFRESMESHDLVNKVLGGPNY